MAEYSILLDGRSDISGNLKGYLYANLSGSTSITATGTKFSYVTPFQVKSNLRIYVSPDTIYPPAIIYDLASVGSISWSSYSSPATISRDVYGTLGTITKTYNTSSYFDATNKTSRTAQISLSTNSINFQFRPSTWDASGTQYLSDTSTRTPITLTVTLDVPPTATLGTPTYATPQYAGLGAYTVPITSAEAYYGGDISKVTLTVGQDSTVQTCSASSISNETISVTPTVAGTYTPTITIEDSRGQTTTNVLPQIVVNPYLAPSLDFDVVRTNNNGVKADEGAYGLITANVSFTDSVANLVQPTVKINGTTTNNVTWYSAYSSSTGVSSAISDWSTISSGDTIYGLINGSFSQTDSYQITVILTDSLGGNSSAITQTLSTAFYTIDFQAGGKEIAFGAPANDNLSQHPNGLFKCAMDVQFEGDVSGVTGSGTSIPTADEVAEFDSSAKMNSTDMTSAQVDDFVDGLNISGGGELIKIVTFTATFPIKNANTYWDLTFTGTAPTGYVPLGIISINTGTSNGGLSGFYINGSGVPFAYGRTFAAQGTTSPASAVVLYIKQ